MNKNTLLTLTKPFDAHLHLRDGTLLQAVLPYTQNHFQGAIIMPNLQPPIDDIQACMAYRQRILDRSNYFIPFMTLYLTERLPVLTVERASHAPFICGIKLYPQGVTTNSVQGVVDIVGMYPIFEAMQKHQVTLLIHAEDGTIEVDAFDREKHFIDRYMQDLRLHFPKLKIVLEHITTQTAIDYVKANAPQVASTITPHHLWFSRNALFEKGIHPHRYCKPILQREQHRKALVKAATSGLPCFFLGTDSAPHIRHQKERDCGCAGIFNSPNAMEIYATIFEREGMLDRLENFSSSYAARFYQISLGTEKIRLRPVRHRVEEHVACEDGEIIPMLAGEQLPWKVCDGKPPA